MKATTSSLSIMVSIKEERLDNSPSTALVVTAVMVFAPKAVSIVFRVELKFLRHSVATLLTILEYLSAILADFSFDSLSGI